MKFNVTLRKSLEQWAEVEIEAENEDAAVQRAFDMDDNGDLYNLYGEAYEDINATVEEKDEGEVC